MKQFSDEQYLRALLRQDFHAFAQQCFSYLYGKRLAPNWHIEAVCWHLTKAVKGTVTRSIINIPPRHLKSFCASVCLPAWILLHDPSAKVICVSYAQSLASNFSLMFRRILQASWYRKLAQVRIDPRKNSEEEIATLQGGYRLATSIGGQLTGRGAQYIIIDDPMKADQAMSEAERTAVLDWYSSALTTRLDDKIGGRIIIVMHRLHEEDLTGHVMANEAWDVLCLPAIARERQVIDLGQGRQHVREPESLLHPAREPRHVLDGLKASMGSYNFETQYQQSPLPAEGNLFKRGWFQRYDTAPKQFRKIVQSWDCASSISEKAAYSVCITFGVTQNRQAYILDVYRERLAYPDLRRQIRAHAQQWHPRAVLVETAGLGLGIYQELREEGGLNVIPVNPKQDKEARAEEQSAFVEAGRVFLPREAPWLAVFEGEILAFPRGRFADQVDAFTQGLEYIGRRNSYEDVSMDNDDLVRPSYFRWE